MVKSKKIKLDKKEEALLKSVEKGEWHSVKQLKKLKGQSQKAATHYTQKDARINIRLSSLDVLKLKRIAAYEGLPYQTLIASVLHKYAAGHLPETKLHA